MEDYWPGRKEQGCDRSVMNYQDYCSRYGINFLSKVPNFENEQNPCKGDDEIYKYRGDERGDSGGAAGASDCYYRRGTGGYSREGERYFREAADWCWPTWQQQDQGGLTAQ